MRIATFNCNSIRTRLDAVLNWLAEYSPDYLCLQETKVQDEDFPLDAFQDAGWQVAFKGEKSYNGVAIISKKAADEVSFGLDTQPADPPRMIHARFGKLHVINTYVPQGRDIEHEMYAYKLEWPVSYTHLHVTCQPRRRNAGTALPKKLSTSRVPTIGRNAPPVGPLPP